MALTLSAAGNQTSYGHQPMTTQYSDLKPDDQEAVSQAMDRALASLQDYGLRIENVDHTELLNALVDVFEQASP